jgi:hypothetical protein
MRHRTWRIPKSPVLECRTTFSDARRSAAVGLQQRYAKHLQQKRRMCQDFFVLEKNLDRGAIATKRCIVGLYAVVNS